MVLHGPNKHGEDVKWRWPKSAAISFSWPFLRISGLCGFERSTVCVRRCRPVVCPPALLLCAPRTPIATNQYSKFVDLCLWFKFTHKNPSRLRRARKRSTVCVRRCRIVLCPPALLLCAPRTRIVTNQYSKVVFFCLWFKFTHTNLSRLRCLERDGTGERTRWKHMISVLSALSCILAFSLHV